MLGITQQGEAQEKLVGGQQSKVTNIISQATGVSSGCLASKRGHFP